MRVQPVSPYAVQWVAPSVLDRDYEADGDPCPQMGTVLPRQNGTTSRADLCNTCIVKAPRGMVEVGDGKSKHDNTQTHITPLYGEQQNRDKSSLSRSRTLLYILFGMTECD
jgi:hypothetical protein